MNESITLAVLLILFGLILLIPGWFFASGAFVGLGLVVLYESRFK